MALLFYYGLHFQFNRKRKNLEGETVGAHLYLPNEPHIVTLK